MVIKMEDAMGEYEVDQCEGLRREDFERCVAIIKAGRAVSVSVAKLQFAAVVALAKKAGEIVGVGTVKAIRPEYAQGIAEKAGFAFPADTPELGYVAVDIVHRGNHLSWRLVDALLATQGGRLFATTDNPYM